MSELLSFKKDGFHTKGYNCILKCVDGINLFFHITYFYSRNQKYFINIFDEIDMSNGKYTINLIKGGFDEVNLYQTLYHGLLIQCHEPNLVIQYATIKSWIPLMEILYISYGHFVIIFVMMTYLQYVCII